MLAINTEDRLFEIEIVASCDTGSMGMTLRTLAVIHTALVVAPW
jgi:hypothetical protein